MSEKLLLALKWYVVALCMVVGTSAFIISEKTGSMKPLMVGLLGYGLAYILSAFWKDFRNRLLMGAIVVFVAVSLLSPYVADIVYVLFGWNLSMNPYMTWAAAEAVLGIPLMMVVFHFYGD